MRSPTFRESSPCFPPRSSSAEPAFLQRVDTPRTFPPWGRQAHWLTWPAASLAHLRQPDLDALRPVFSTHKPVF